MPIVDALVQCPVHDSFRVRQVAGIFDVTLPVTCQEQFKVEVPCGDENWQIGVIVGPSGSGKSTIARQAFGDQVHVVNDWPTDRAVVDGFGEKPVRDIVGALTAVGFSSPPSWIKPYPVLSNGEKFRCDLARALLDDRTPITVFDEFTSVVDRTVAKIGSAAVAKAIRSGRIHRRFVAVTCHYDVVPWLEPDWVIDMASQSLARGRLRRPSLELSIHRADRTWWPLFKRHHYLSSSLHRAAACFVGLIEGSPATFTAVMSFPHPTRPGWREHRTVCLPDFQGVGLGNAMSEFIGGVYRATGKPYYSTTSHPSMIRHRCRSPLWRVTRTPKTMTSTHQDPRMAASGSAGRLTGGFEYIGPARPEDARRLGVGIGVGSRRSGYTNGRNRAGRSENLLRLPPTTYRLPLSTSPEGGHGKNPHPNRSG